MGTGVEIAAHNGGHGGGGGTPPPASGKIAYQKNLTNGVQVFVVNADGTGATQLTSDGTNGTPSCSPGLTREKAQHMLAGGSQRQ